MTNHHLTDKKRIDRMLEMMYQALTKSGNSCNVQTHNGIWANQKTESVVYRWLRSQAMTDITCFFAFVGVSDIT